MFLPKTHNLNLVMKKQQIKPNRGIFWKIGGQHTSKVLRSRKTKVGSGLIPDQVRLEILTTKCSVNPGWDLGKEKGYS